MLIFNCILNNQSMKKAKETMKPLRKQEHLKAHLNLEIEAY